MRRHYTSYVLFILSVALFAGLFLHPKLTLATQTHNEPEGLIVHQIAHLFFIISMAVFAYQLKARKLTKLKGWRYVCIAAILLIIWNIDAALVHFLDEQLYVLHIKQIDLFHLHLETANGFEFLGFIYYALKLDHFWCVPALLFLYLGLRKLSKEIKPLQQEKD